MAAKKSFVLYNIAYDSRADAIRALGLEGYQQLEIVERCAKANIPLEQAKRHLSHGSKEASRRRRFAAILKKHGFWNGESGE